MAQKVQVLLVDDLDGGEAQETVSFGLDGASYEIDLSSDNAKRIREGLTPYVEAARKVGGRAGRGRGRGGRAGRSADTARVRAWAKDHGYEVSERGRIPSNIIEEYAKAHG